MLIHLVIGAMYSNANELQCIWRKKLLVSSRMQYAHTTAVCLKLVIAYLSLSSMNCKIEKIWFLMRSSSHDGTLFFCKYIQLTVGGVQMNEIRK